MVILFFRIVLVDTYLVDVYAAWLADVLQEPVQIRCDL
jgi:hypothetical protein